MSLKLAEQRFKGRLIGPYQRTGVEWMIQRELADGIKGGFLCDEMGLGKTIEIIATMLGNHKRRTLIVAPKSVLSQWRDEIKRFSGQTLYARIWDGPTRTEDAEVLGGYDVVITSYSLLRKASVLHRIQWGRVVFDEAHEIRNPKAKTHLAAYGLRAQVKWLVSGTPVFNSIRDFAALAHLLGISKAIVQGYTQETCDKYVLRRTKEDVRIALVPCDFENIELEMNPEEKELYKFVFESSKDTIRGVMRQQTQGMAMIMIECLLRTRQVMIWPQLYYDGFAIKNEAEAEVFMGRSKKHDTLIEMINTHPNERSLIFCQFKGEMDQIQQRLDGLPVFRIDGSVSKDAREVRIQSFRKTNGAIFIIQIKAGGVGLNLQEATRVYITSPSWNPATEMQAIARAHRTGQVNKVIVRKLVYAGEEGMPSIEQSIMQLQNHKAVVCAAVLNDPRLEVQIPKSKATYTVHDLKKLFA